MTEGREEEEKREKRKGKGGGREERKGRGEEREREGGREGERDTERRGGEKREREKEGGEEGEREEERIRGRERKSRINTRAETSSHECNKKTHGNLEVGIKLEGMGAALGSRHNTGLLVVADPLFKEVGLALKGDHIHPLEGVAHIVNLGGAEGH
jgi:hypothetical protein